MESGLLKVQRQAKKTHDSVSLGFQRLSEHSLKYQRETEAQTAALKRQEVQARQTAAAAAKIGSNTLLSPAFQGLGNGGGRYSATQGPVVQNATRATQQYARRLQQDFRGVRTSIQGAGKALDTFTRRGLPAIGDLTTGVAGLALAFDSNLGPLARLTSGVAGVTSLASGLRSALPMLGRLAMAHPVGAAVVVGTTAVMSAARVGYQMKITAEKRKQAEIERQLIPIQNEIYRVEAQREAVAKRLLEVRGRDIELMKRQAALAGRAADREVTRFDRQLGRRDGPQQVDFAKQELPDIRKQASQLIEAIGNVTDRIHRDQSGILPFSADEEQRLRLREQEQQKLKELREEQFRLKQKEFSALAAIEDGQRRKEQETISGLNAIVGILEQREGFGPEKRRIYDQTDGRRDRDRIREQAGKLGIPFGSVDELDEATALRDRARRSSLTNEEQRDLDADSRDVLADQLQGRIERLVVSQEQTNNALNDLAAVINKAAEIYKQKVEEADANRTKAPPETIIEKALDTISKGSALGAMPSRPAIPRYR